MNYQHWFNHMESAFNFILLAFVLKNCIHSSSEECFPPIIIIYNNISIIFKLPSVMLPISHASQAMQSNCGFFFLLMLAITSDKFKRFSVK